MPRRAHIIGLLLCLCLVRLNAAPHTERIEFYYGIAEGSYLIGDLGGAERGIEQMLRIDSTYIPAWTLKARVLLDKNDSEAALAAAERAIALEPQKHEHTLLKALILGQMARPEEASKLIEQVIAQASPESDDARAAHQLLGLLRMAAGEWDQAAAAFNQIYHADPASAQTSLRLSSEAFLEKARAALQRGAHEDAVSAMDQAIAVYQKQSGKESLQQRTSLRLMRARLLAQMGRHEAAIQDLQTLTGQQAENFEAHITLASLYASVARWESLEGLIPSIAARPELKDIALYLEGRVALAKNRVGSARAKFEEAIEHLPKDADQLRRNLYFYRGICLQALGRSDEANTAILHAVDAGFRPETSEEAITASRALIAAKRANDAIPLLEAMTLNRIHPSAEVWALLGRAHIAEGSIPLALSALNESLSIEPEQSSTLALRGSQLRKLGDLVGALADYESALQLDPSNASLHYAIGLVHLQLGHILEAEKAIQTAAQQLTDQAGLQLLQSLLAYTIGHHADARNSLAQYQALINEDRNETAIHLDYILNAKPYPGHLSIAAYTKGSASRKEILDQAGRANTPESARTQLCATAFWMAQHEKGSNNHSAYLELLQIAVDIGSPDLTEYQLSKWQLSKLRH